MSKSKPAPWRVDYDNDTGPNGDGFWEWWEVSTEDHMVAKCAAESDAKKIASIPVMEAELSRLRASNAELREALQGLLAGYDEEKPRGSMLSKMPAALNVRTARRGTIATPARAPITQPAPQSGRRRSDQRTSNCSI